MSWGIRGATAKHLEVPAVVSVKDAYEPGYYVARVVTTRAESIDAGYKEARRRSRTDTTRQPFGLVTP